MRQMLEMNQQYFRDTRQSCFLLPLQARKYSIVRGVIIFEKGVLSNHIWNNEVPKILVWEGVHHTESHSSLSYIKTSTPDNG
jgi:hypothetical protein